MESKNVSSVLNKQLKQTAENRFDDEGIVTAACTFVTKKLSSYSEEELSELLDKPVQLNHLLDPMLDEFSFWNEFYKTVEYLSNRRFSHDPILAEEAAGYVIDKVSHNDWSALRRYKDQPISTLGKESEEWGLVVRIVKNALEDFYQKRYGKIRPPKMLQELDKLAIRVYHMFYEEHRNADDIVFLMCKKNRLDPNRVRQRIPAIRALVPNCGKQTSGDENPPDMLQLLHGTLGVRIYQLLCIERKNTEQVVAALTEGCEEKSERIFRNLIEIVRVCIQEKSASGVPEFLTELDALAKKVFKKLLHGDNRETIKSICAEQKWERECVDRVINVAKMVLPSSFSKVMIPYEE